MFYRELKGSPTGGDLEGASFCSYLFEHEQAVNCELISCFRDLADHAYHEWKYLIKQGAYFIASV